MAKSFRYSRMEDYNKEFQSLAGRISDAEARDDTDRVLQLELFRNELAEEFLRFIADGPTDHSDPKASE